MLRFANVVIVSTFKLKKFCWGDRRWLRFVPLRPNWWEWKSDCHIFCSRFLTPSYFFRKFNAQGALDKVVEWQQTSQMLRQRLPDDDPVLTTWSEVSPDVLVFKRNDSGAGNLFAITGHLNCGISLGGQKVINFLSQISTCVLPRKITREIYEKEREGLLLIYCLRICLSRFEVMLCSNLGNENSDVGHSKS